MEKIEYREIPGHPDYYASSNGEILSRKSGELRPINSVYDTKGYLYCRLGRGNRQSVHRLILETFIGKRPEGLMCRHLDGNRRNNAVSNLCWGTAQQNSEDMIRHGTSTRGEKHPHAKLTESQVLEILFRLSSGESQKSVAKRFGVCKANICTIAAGKSWGHLQLR